MADLDEPSGQNVQQEPPDELLRIDCGRFLFVAVCGVSPAKRYVGVAEADQASVGDCHSVCVASQILDDVVCCERRFCVDDPFGASKLPDETIELRRV